MLGAQRPRHDRRVCDVLVSLVADQRFLAVPIVGRQETVDFGKVHPGQEVRVVCCVPPPVVRSADDPFVDAVHDIDGPLRFGCWPERRGREKVGGALEPAPRIAAVIGEFGDAGHREWVQRLEEDGPHPADEHRRVAMNPSDRCIVGEPSRFVGIEELTTPFVGIRTDDPITDLTAEPIMVTQCGELINGQHRLQAVVLSGKTVNFTLATVPDSSTFRVLDQGRVRNNSDVLGE